MAKDEYKRQKNAKQHGGAIRHVVGLFASFLCGYLVANVVDLPSAITWVNQHWANYQTADQRVPAAVTAASVKQAEIPKPKFEFYTLLSKDNNAPVAAIREVAQPAPQLAAALPANVNPSSVQSAQSGASAAQQQPVVQTDSQRGNPPQISFEVHTANDGAVPVTNAKASVPVAESQPVAPVSESPTPKLVKKEAYLIQIAAVTRRGHAERLKASLTLKGYGVMIISPTDTKSNWFRVVIGPFHSRPEAEKAQLNVARTEHIQGMIRKIDV